MRPVPGDSTYRLELSGDERAALIWALEVGRALLLHDPDLGLLAHETAVRPALLDALADRLVVAGCSAPTYPSVDAATPNPA